MPLSWPRSSTAGSAPAYSRGSSRGAEPLYSARCKKVRTPRPPPTREGTTSRSRVNAPAPTVAPLGGSGAATPQGALRAIDSPARPRSWRTCGPRRLRRQSQPGLLATQGGIARALRCLTLARSKGTDGPCGLGLSPPFSTPSRAKRTKIARWRVQRSLILLVQLLLSEQLIPFPFSSPLANHAINELRRPAWPACSAAAMSRVHGVWLGLMPVPELSQGITIFVPALERGRYLFLVLAAMATRDGEGLYPSIPMIRLPSDQCGRIARISLGMVRAWSTDSLVGRKAAAGASRLGTIRAQGSGYRSVVGRWLHARSHRAPVVSGSAWDEQ
jgi:hypothetical protein